MWGRGGGSEGVVEGIRAVRVVKLLRNFKELCGELSEHSEGAEGAAEICGRRTKAGGVANKYKKK